MFPNDQSFAIQNLIVTLVMFRHVYSYVCYGYINSNVCHGFQVSSKRIFHHAKEHDIKDKICFNLYRDNVYANIKDPILLHIHIRFDSV